MRFGLVFGLALGLWHALWAGLVAADLAQPLLNWVLALHFLSININVTSFDATTAAVLVGFTASVGFVAGALIAVIWNAAAGGKRSSAA